MKNIDKVLMDLGPIRKVFKSARYNDEPLFYQFNVLYEEAGVRDERKSVEWGGGIGLSRGEALIKATGEALERYCMSKCSYNDFFKATTDSIDDSHMDLSKVVSFSENQLNKETFRDFRISSSSLINWVEGVELRSDREVLIPAQLIYVPYIFDEEQILRLPISTGAAAGRNKKEAVYRGLCEVIERDAFMIFYLNKLKPKKLSLANSKESQELVDCFDRYKLELSLFDITTDVGIPVVMAVLIDKTDVGPKISIGLKCSLDYHEAVRGAILEAQHIRPWMRDEAMKLKARNKSKLQEIRDGSKEISKIIDRGLYWYNLPKNKLDFWLGGEWEIKKIPEKIGARLDENPVEVVSSKLGKLGYDSFVVDLSDDFVEEHGIKVVKVVVPELHPLYLDERYPYLGGKRLYEVPVKLGMRGERSRQQDLNSVPHPFL